MREDEGQDLLEHALLVALIAVVAVWRGHGGGHHREDIFTTITGQRLPAA